MNHNSFPSGSEAAPQSQDNQDAEVYQSFEEHMQEVSDRGGEADAGKENLEEKRKKFIDMYTLKAVQSMGSIYDAVNETSGDSEKIVDMYQKQWASDVFPRQTWDGSTINPSIAAIAYRAGAALFAGSEEGLKKTSELTLEYSDLDKASFNGVNGTRDLLITSRLDGKKTRLIQAGVAAIEKAMPEVIMSAAERITPEKQTEGE